MIRVGDLAPGLIARAADVVQPGISVVHVGSANASRSRDGELDARPVGDLPTEHVLVQEVEAGAAAGAPNPAGPGVAVVEAPGLQLPALSCDVGLAATSREWVWFRPAGQHWDPAAVRDIAEALDRSSSEHVAVLRDAAGPGMTIDGLYNGVRPRLHEVLWRRDVFLRWGCFDPHLAIGDEFAFDLLVRMVRHARVMDVLVRRLPPGPGDARRAREAAEVLSYGQVRRSAPTLATLAGHELDDLSEVEARLGASRAWDLYLTRVLPYVYANRHRLPPAQFVAPQSLPRRRMAALFTKVQYETSNELTFWNYQRRFAGGRRFHFSYLQSETLCRPDSRLLDADRLAGFDVLVSTRTADVYNAALVADQSTNGRATAYLTDDDLLTFHEYGGSFASMAPGTPAYEAMSEAIAAADVVVGFAEQIRSSVSGLNPRYVEGEDSVPLELLPATAEKPETPGPFRFGYAGGGYRTEEFALLLPAMRRMVAEYGDRVRFSFWGMRPEDVPQLGNAEFMPFSPHYLEYLERLSGAGFDAMLVPLLDHPAPKRAKNANKFMEAAIANAVGLYSEVATYGVVRHLQTGIKVAANTDAWYEAMKLALELGPDERARIRRHALAYVREFYSAPAVSWVNETGILAADLHRKTRHKRGDDGRPTIAFFFPCVLGTGGGEIQLWRRFEVAQRLGFRLLVVMAKAWEGTPDAERVCRYLAERGVDYEFVTYNAFYVTPETDDILPTAHEMDSLREFFRRRAAEISLAHSLAFLPAVGQACSEFGIPHVASIYGVADDYQIPSGRLPFKYCDLVQSDSIRYARKWASLLHTEWICCRETVPAPVFDLGFERVFMSDGRPPAEKPLVVAMAGTFMARKGHLEAIEAVGLLDDAARRRVELHLYGGVDVYPEYGMACREARDRVRRLGGTVHFHGHVRDVAAIYRGTDVVLSVSTFESFPSAIKEATAAGCLVVASRAGGITEMMVDGANCLLVGVPDRHAIAAALTKILDAPAADLDRIRRAAFTLAREEFHPRRTLHDLALTYNLCIDSAAGIPGARHAV
ncbi:MAG TPA: glycosyltransferase [Vicinamibacteria bacterium]|nr:glycosyltransferase [Vicinamibacteria bacterium]